MTTILLMSSQLHDHHSRSSQLKINFIFIGDNHQYVAKRQLEESNYRAEIAANRLYNRVDVLPAVVYVFKVSISNLIRLML